jgi:molybdate transport system regulatory protein
VKAYGGAVRVAVKFESGWVLFALITKESAQLLGLKKGLKVFLLFKATAVRVTASLNERVGENVFSAHVVRAPRGKGGGEIALTVSKELNVVGFVSPGEQLKVGDEVGVSVEESALVIALQT